MLARRGRRARRPAQGVAEPGVPARTPAAAGMEAELPGVSSQRSHAKRHLAARESSPERYASAPREQPVGVGTSARPPAGRLRTDGAAAAAESPPPTIPFLWRVS